MTRRIAGWLLVTLCMLAAASAKAQAPTTITCSGGDLPSQGPEQPRPPKVPQAPPQPNLLIRGMCNVAPGQEYLYGNVNILDSGVLKFSEDINSRTNFWASSIIIENGGTMTAGTPANPFGKQGGILTIHLYATRQTYQIYVGPGFNVDNDVEAGHADLNTSPVVKFDTVAWPATWTRNYNDDVACPKTNLTCGILQVTVDFGASGFSDLDLKAANGLCLPHTFCSDAADAEKAPGKDCGCALKDDDPLVLAGGKAFKQECVKVCGSWAVKDLDFRQGGGVGVLVQIAEGVHAGRHARRPIAAPPVADDVSGYGQHRQARLADQARKDQDRARPEQGRLLLSHLEGARRNRLFGDTISTAANTERGD